MSQLNFPDNPLNGQLYPNPCPEGVTQYKWESSTGIWRIVGVATGVTPGQYGNDTTVGQFTVDVTGKITQASNVSIRLASEGVPGIVPLTSALTSVSTTTALSAFGGKKLQDQIGNLNNCIVPDHTNVVAALNDLQNQTIQLQENGLIWCGYYNAEEGDISFVSIAGRRLGYELGQELPLASLKNGGDMFIVTRAGNPFVAGDNNAPDAFIEAGNWIVSEATRWSEVKASGNITAKQVPIDPIDPLTAVNVQGALQQIVSSFRTGIGGATISEEKPGNPYPGQLWWDSNDGLFYVFYRDINGSQWVEAGGGAGSGLSQAGGGTVYEVRTGVGLVGGPITTEGTIDLVPTFVDNFDFSKSVIGGVIPRTGLIYDNSTGIFDVALSGDPEGASPEIAFSQEGAYLLNAKVDSLSGSNILAGTYDAAVGQLTYVTPIAATKGFVVGQNLPAPSREIDNYYVIVTIGGDEGPGGPGEPSQSGDWWICQAELGTTPTWFLVDYENRAVAAVNVSVQSIPGIAGATNVQGALEAIEAQAQDRIEFATATSDGLDIDVTPVDPDGYDGTTLSIGVHYASVDDRGIVQLTDDITGSSETLAPTQKAVSELNSKVESLVGTNILAGTYDSNQGRMASVTVAGAQHGFEVGQQAPPAYSVPDNYFVIVSIPGGYGPPGAVIPATGVQAGDWFIVQNDAGVAEWVTIDFENRVVSAIQVDFTPYGFIDATNVQFGMQQLVDKIDTQVVDITSTNDALTVTRTDENVSLTVNPATVNDLGGIIVGENLYIEPSGRLNALATPGANILGGTYSSKTGTVLSVTPAGRQYLTVGENCPPADTVPDNYYVLVTESGDFGPPGAIIPSGGVQSGDWFLCENPSPDTATWVTIDFENRIIPAVNVTVAPIPGIDAALNAQDALEALELQAQDRIEFCDVNGGGLTATVSAPVLTGNDGTTLTLDVATADVDVKGMVTLTNDLTGDSTTLAPTQFAISGLNDKVEALTGSNVLAGTYNSAEGIVSTVTPAGAQYLTAGQPAPAASALPDNYYLLVTVSGKFGPPGAVIPPAGVQSGDWFVVEKETGSPATWVTIDFENEAVAAVNVTLSAVPGLSATNVQTGVEQLATKTSEAFTEIEAPTANGIRVTNTAASATGRTSTIQLLPATQTDLGGVFVQDDLGLILGGDGSLRAAIASDTVLGSVKVGRNLTIDPDGTLNAEAVDVGVSKIIAGQYISVSPISGTGDVTISCTGGSADEIIISSIPGIDTARTVQDALEAIELQVQDRVEFCDVEGAGGLTAAVSAPVATSNDGTTLTLTTARANTTQVGVTQLTTDYTGDSEELALTQKAGNELNNKIDALVGGNVLAGTYDSSTGLVVSVSPAGSSYFTVGQQAPAATTLPDNYYLLVVKSGFLGPPGAPIPAIGVQSGDWFVVENQPPFAAAWVTIDFENEAVAAVQVSLSDVPGLAATNVQEAVEELEGKATKAITDIEAPAADRISVTLGPITENGRTAELFLGAATSTDLGGIFVQPDQGLVLGANGSLVLDIASATKLGGIKVGRNLTIDPDGTLNAADGGGGSATDIIVSPPISGIDTATNVQEALEAIELQAQDRIEFCDIVGEGLTAQVSEPDLNSNDGTTLTLTVENAGVGVRGSVELTDDITGTSEELAPTQKAVSELNSKVDALVGANVLAGTYNSTTGLVVSVTPAGSAYLTVDQPAPAADTLPDNYYLLVVVSGDSGPPGATIPPTGVQSGDWFVVEKEPGQTAVWVTIDFENISVAAVNVSLSPVPGLAATNVQEGVSELADDFSNSFTEIEAPESNGIQVTNTDPSETGRTSTIELLPATATDLGGVFVQPNLGLTLGANGGLSLAIASETTLGGIKVGANLTIDPDGTLNAEGRTTAAEIRSLDSIANLFNGATTTFALTYAGNRLPDAVTTAYTFITVGGILQSPGISYTVANSTITFTEAPPSGARFSGRAVIDNSSQISNEDVDAQVEILDDISPQFDGVKVRFPLLIGGNPVPVSLSSLYTIINLGGVFQTPDSSYLISNGDIIFDEPPPAGTVFSGRVILRLILGDPGSGGIESIEFLSPLTGGTITETGQVGILEASDTNSGVITPAQYGVLSKAGTNSEGNRFVSTSAPTAAQGKDGDIWYQI